MLDIVENPKSISIQEFEAAAVPRMLADIGLAVINSNYAVQAGGEVVGTVIAIREELKTLVGVLRSSKMVQWIKDTYGTSVISTK